MPQSHTKAKLQATDRNHAKELDTKVSHISHISHALYPILQYCCEMEIYIKDPEAPVRLAENMHKRSAKHTDDEISEETYIPRHITLNALQALIVKYLIKGNSFAFDESKGEAHTAWSDRSSMADNTISEYCNIINETDANGKSLFDEIKDKKIVYLPMLVSDRMGKNKGRNSPTAYKKNFEVCLRGLLRTYKNTNTPLPEKFVLQSGTTEEGGHVVTIIFNNATGQCQVLDDQGKCTDSHRLYSNAINIMNIASERERIGEHFEEQKIEYVLKEGEDLHSWVNPGEHGATQNTKSPFSENITYHIPALIGALIAARGNDAATMREAMCKFVEDSSTNIAKYSDVELSENANHAFGKASWQWYISLAYHIVETYSESLSLMNVVVVGEGRRLSPAKSFQQNILGELMEFARANGFDILDIDHPSMLMMRESEIVGEGPKNVTPPAPNQQAEMGAYSVIRPCIDDKQKAERRSQIMKIVREKIKEWRKDGKIGEPFKRYLSIFRRIPIIRNIVEFFLETAPFSWVFMRFSAEYRIAELIQCFSNSMESRVNAAPEDEDEKKLLIDELNKNSATAYLTEIVDLMNTKDVFQDSFKHANIESVELMLKNAKNDSAKTVKALSSTDPSRLIDEASTTGGARNPEQDLRL